MPIISTTVSVLADAWQGRRRPAFATDQGRRPMRLAVIAASFLALGAAVPATAAPINVTFGAYNNLAFGTGTNQTLNLSPFRMTVTSGLYEVTFANELNLKDYTGAIPSTPRTVVFSLASGANFDFDSINVQDFFGPLQVTTSSGGSATVNSFGTTNFSSPLFDNISSVTLSTNQRFGEFKINSLLFNDSPTVPTVPEPVSLALLGTGLLGLGLARRRRA